MHLHALPSLPNSTMHQHPCTNTYGLTPMPVKPEQNPDPKSPSHTPPIFSHFYYMILLLYLIEILRNIAHITGAIYQSCHFCSMFYGAPILALNFMFDILGLRSCFNINWKSSNNTFIQHRRNILLIQKIWISLISKFY